MKTALVLSGGGSRGAYQVGAYLGMREHGCRPDMVVGTSVGAINGALIVSGKSPKELREVWTSLDRRSVALTRVDVWRFWKWRSLLRHDPLRKLLTHGVDYDAIHQSDIEFRITAVDMCCGEVETFTNEEITVEHLLASAAIPGVFPPVEIGGHTYMDGGIVNNTPLRPAVREGADRIFLVLTDPAEPHPEPAPKNVLDVLSRVTDIHMHQALAREIIKGHEINALLQSGAAHADWRPIEFHIVSPHRPLQGNVINFDPERTRELIALGEADGRRAMEEAGRPPEERRRFWHRLRG